MDLGEAQLELEVAHHRTYVTWESFVQSAVEACLCFHMEFGFS